MKSCPECGQKYDEAARFCQRDGAALLAPKDEGNYLGRVLLDQFRVDEVVGEGGMGTVYRARQLTVDRDVAIKILQRGSRDDAEAAARFRREATLVGRLHHPNLIDVFLAGRLEDGAFYLVMPFLEGRTLDQELQSHETEYGEPIPVAQALRIAQQVCDGLGQAHRQGIVHRDIKPDNIFLERRPGRPVGVKILDFGIAREFQGDSYDLTQQGFICGTAHYISPEGAQGAPTDARSDVYSIGVLLYRMLGGVVPFEATTPLQVLVKHVSEEPPDLSRRLPSGRVPPAVTDAVMQALTKDPARRPQDAAAFGALLRTAAGEAETAPEIASWTDDPRPPSVPPVRPADPARWPIALTAFGVGVALVLALGAYVPWGGSVSTPPASPIKVVSAKTSFARSPAETFMAPKAPSNDSIEASADEPVSPPLPPARTTVRPARRQVW